MKLQLITTDKTLQNTIDSSVLQHFDKVTITSLEEIGSEILDDHFHIVAVSNCEDKDAEWLVQVVGRMNEAIVVLSVDESDCASRLASVGTRVILCDIDTDMAGVLVLLSKILIDSDHSYIEPVDVYERLLPAGSVARYGDAAGANPYEAAKTLFENYEDTEKAESAYVHFVTDTKTTTRNISDAMDIIEGNIDYDAVVLFGHEPIIESETRFAKISGSVSLYENRAATPQEYIMPPQKSTKSGINYTTFMRQ